ncbi:hypothetical protein OC844_007756, partial [Tilletia horrida]
ATSSPSTSALQKMWRRFHELYEWPSATSRFTKLGYPDTTILRFLRARKWDVDRAEGGLKDVPDFLNQFRRDISYIRSSTDTPDDYLIVFIHVRRHLTSSHKVEVLQQAIHPAAYVECPSPLTPPYKKAIVIFDITGFRLKNMDWQRVLFLVKCLETYSPESLRRIYMHTAPCTFKGIWHILQPMLHPVIREKINFSYKASELVDYVTYSKLREATGGTMKWEWNYIKPPPSPTPAPRTTSWRRPPPGPPSARSTKTSTSTSFEEVHGKQLFQLRMEAMNGVRSLLTQHFVKPPSVFSPTSFCKLRTELPGLVTDEVKLRQQKAVGRLQQRDAQEPTFRDACRFYLRQHGVKADQAVL